VIFTHFVREMVFSYGSIALHHKENLAMIFSLCGFIHLEAKVCCLTAQATAGQWFIWLPDVTTQTTVFIYAKNTSSKIYSERQM